MADAATAEPTPVPADGSAVSAAPMPPTAAPPIQLTQVRVPLLDAPEAFATPDESGRQPMVIVPAQALRLRNELVILGVVAIAVAVFLDVTIPVRGGVVAVGALLIVLGVFRAFIVPVPEGSQAVLLRRGRFDRTLGPGNHIVPPWIIVSHLVTTRETPFDAPVPDVPTRDDVRTSLTILLTFRVASPEKFVFAVTVPDFDRVCQASCQEAVRALIRSKSSDEVLDLGDPDFERLRSDIAAALAPYGTDVTRVVVVDVRPPADFVIARESQRLAAVRRAEEKELHALALLRLADQAEQDREQIRARRAAIELEAANEVERLGRLDARLREYPTAMDWEVEGRRLDVAEALASNTRAMVQVGQGLDVAGSLLMQIPSATDAVPDAEGNGQSRSG